MPYIPRSTKSPTDSFPFEFDYTGWPQLVSDDIASATASATPSGLTLGSPTVGTGDDAEKVFVNISGGTEGVTYRITVLATTDNASVLTGYLDLLVTAENPSGIVVYPSQLVPYMDTKRVMELLYDEDELVDSVTGASLPTPSINTIDGNVRAHTLAASAWATVKSATRRGNIYRDRELIDLANDPVRGQMLIELLANIFWCRLLKRRRYVSDEPQGKDPACEEAERVLMQLQQGVRIFVLDGVVSTDSDGNATGTYDNPLGDATTMSTGRLGGDVCCNRRDQAFWGCTDICPPNYGSRSRRNRDGCC